MSYGRQLESVVETIWRRAGRVGFEWLFGVGMKEGVEIAAASLDY